MIGTPIDVASQLFLLMMTTVSCMFFMREQYDTIAWCHQVKVTPYLAISLTQGRHKLTMQAKKENTAGYATWPVSPPCLSYRFLLWRPFHVKIHVDGERGIQLDAEKNCSKCLYKVIISYSIPIGAVTTWCPATGVTATGSPVWGGGGSGKS